MPIGDATSPTDRVSHELSTGPNFHIALTPPNVPLPSSAGRLIAFTPAHPSWSASAHHQQPNGSAEGIFLDYADTKGTPSCFISRPDLAAVHKRRRRKVNADQALLPAPSPLCAQQKEAGTSSPPSLALPYFEGTVVMEFAHVYIVDSPNFSHLLTLLKSVVDAFRVAKQQELFGTPAPLIPQRTSTAAVEEEQESVLGSRVRFQIHPQHHQIHRILKMVASRRTMIDGETQTEETEECLMLIVTAKDTVKTETAVMHEDAEVQTEECEGLAPVVVAAVAVPEIDADVLRGAQPKLSGSNEANSALLPG